MRIFAQKPVAFEIVFKYKLLRIGTRGGCGAAKFLWIPRRRRPRRKVTNLSWSYSPAPDMHYVFMNSHCFRVISGAEGSVGGFTRSFAGPAAAPPCRFTVIRNVNTEALCSCHCVVFCFHVKCAGKLIFQFMIRRNIYVQR